MSISTLESRESLRLLDARDSLDERRDSAEDAARREIQDAFNLLHFLPAKQIAVPTTLLRHDSIRVGSVSMEEAITELTSEGRAMPQLLKILQSSDCPLVQEYRQALCAEWQRQNAADIAEARA